ncbi:MAG: response regulator transcription factor [Lacunisphaera sp.]
MEAKSLRRESVRVVIVDDHILFKELLTGVVNAMEGMRVVGWAQTEAEAVQLCQRERPDVIILDLLLRPASSELIALPRLRHAGRDARVLIFSGNLTPANVRRVLAVGAFSLIGKSATLEEFRQALHTVAEGRTYFSPEIAATIRSLVATSRGRPIGGGQRLTGREEAVLIHLARGLSSKEIGATLGLSPHTVANHRNRLMRKIGLHRVAQLSVYAARQGLIEGDTVAARKPSARRRAS